ncbi:MAG: MFS transporter, partial [Rhodospirillaceae bacterium]
MTTPPDIPSADATARAVAGLACATLLSSLGVSIANVALPTLSAAFAAPVGRVQWVALAYLIAMTVAVVPAGRLGDVIGRRRGGTDGAHRLGRPRRG